MSRRTKAEKRAARRRRIEEAEDQGVDSTEKVPPSAVNKKNKNTKKSHASKILRYDADLIVSDMITSAVATVLLLSFVILLWYQQQYGLPFFPLF